MACHQQAVSHGVNRGILQAACLERPNGRGHHGPGDPQGMGNLPYAQVRGLQ